MSSNRPIKRDANGLSGEDYRKIGTGEKAVPKKRTTANGYMPTKVRVKSEGNDMTFSKTKKRGIVAMRANDQKPKQHNA